MDKPVAEEEQQHQRTFLRERFLRMLTSVSGWGLEVRLCNEDVVTAKFGACDVDILHLQVNDLKTPIGTHPSAILRTSDIVSVCVTPPN